MPLYIICFVENMLLGRKDTKMGFELDVSGVKIELEISGYKLTNKKNQFLKWCICGFRFSSENWLNYHKENDEILLCCELDELIDALTDLIDNEIQEVKEISFIEPDFVFELYPKVESKDKSQHFFIKPGFEIRDIYLEWKVYILNKGFTANYLTITLWRDNIINLRDYLVSVKNDKP